MTDIDAAFDAFDAGDFEKAEKLCRATILRNSELPAPHYLLGTLLGIQNKLGEAIDHLRLAKKYAPLHLSTNLNLANLLHKTGELREALNILNQLDQSACLNTEGLALKAGIELDLGDSEKSLLSADAALHQDIDCLPAIVAKANACAKLGRHEEALQLYEKAITLDDSSQLVVNKARILQDCGDLEEALRTYDNLLGREASNIDSLIGKALVLGELDRSEEAERIAFAALSLSPRSQEAQLAIAAAYRRADKNENARKILESLLKNQKDSRTLILYAQVLSNLCLYDKAIEACTEAIALEPDRHEAFLQRALIRLLIGDFVNGFEDYEHRLLVPYNVRTTLKQQSEFLQIASHNLELQKIKGRRLLIVEEQGIGDVIMFSGLIPDLLEHSLQFELVVQTRLLALIRRSFPDITIHALEEFPRQRAKNYDYVMMMGSLPYLFRHQQWRFKKRSYLKADPDKVSLWKERLAVREKKLIGLSWRGGTRGTHERRRSLELSVIQNLVETRSAQFISLQHDVSNEERLIASDFPLKFFQTENLNDIDNLAALISALDGVITVQNTNVHLCGALGLPCFVLLPSIPEWRYGIEGNVMAWYQTPQLFRGLKTSPDALRSQFQIMMDSIKAAH